MPATAITPPKIVREKYLKIEPLIYPVDIQLNPLYRRQFKLIFDIFDKFIGRALLYAAAAHTHTHTHTRTHTHTHTLKCVTVTDTQYQHLSTFALFFFKEKKSVIQDHIEPRI